MRVRYDAHLGVLVFGEMSRSHRPDVEDDRGVVRQLRREVVGVVQGALDGETCKKGAVRRGAARRGRRGA